MAWALEIHHIDVVSLGDATLIVVREVAPLAGAAPRVRTALIDGGTYTWSPVVGYVINALGAGQELNVLVATHYDKDHLGGLVNVLLQPGLCDHVRIYDQGWAALSGDSVEDRYLRAINGRTSAGIQVIPLAIVNQRTRVTSRVQADAVPVVPPINARNLGAPAVPPFAAINLAPHWLLGGPPAPQEILWDGVLGGPPAGAPQMRCIAVNKYVRGVGPGGGIGGPYQGGGGADPRNEKSLAFVVTFNSFRYYVGGDLENAQETWVQVALNPNNNVAGRVLAFKTSHHGAATGTSRAFVDQLRPAAAFISCGTSNQHLHPSLQTVNVLDGFAANPGGVGPVVPHGPGVPPFRPVENYLTGYQVPGQPPPGPPPASLGGDVSVTAGDPTAVPVQRGDIVLRVDDAQSHGNQRGKPYLEVKAAVTAAATAPGIAGQMAAGRGGAADAAATAAADAAMSFGAGPAASAALVSAGFVAAGAPVAAAVNVALAAAAAPAAGAVAAAATVAAVNAGASHAAAAAAGAAAGRAADNLSPAAAQQAVAAAIGALPAPVAVPVVPPVPGTLFSVELWELNAMHNPTTYSHA
jgi:hypothetical protein